MKQVERIQSDFVIEELNIGNEVIDGFTNQISTITGKTANSIEVFITADKTSIKKKGKKLEEVYDAMELGDVAGINYKNWFELTQFNRRFKRK